MKKLFLLLLVVLPLNAFSQERLSITTGISFPDFINFGLRYQVEQLQVGISYGFWPIPDESLNNFSGNIYYHFGGSSQYTDLRTWYGGIGLLYLKDESEYSIDKYLYLNTRIGKEFNISEHAGFTLEVGAIFELSNEYVVKQPSYFGGIDVEAPVLPCLGLGFFYRL